MTAAAPTSDSPTTKDAAAGRREPPLIGSPKLEPRPGFDATAPTPALAQIAASALIYLCAGASLTVAFQFAAYRDLAGFVAANDMPLADRRLLLISGALGGACACAVAAAYLLWRRNRAAVDAVMKFARIVSPLMLAFAVPLLFDWRVFRGKHLVLALGASLFGLGLERTLRASFGSFPWARVRRRVEGLRLAFPRLVRWLPHATVAGLGVFFAAYFSRYTILHHYRLQTQSWDMAIFDNMLWNLMRGEWFKASPDLGRTGSHIQYHATFLAYALVPFYALWQKAQALLVAQATICGAGAIPVYLLVKHRLGSAWIGVAFAYAYVAYAPLHGPIFYDFHFLTLAPFFVGWVLYFFETGRRWWLVAAWIAALLLREDVSAGLAMACLFYLLCGDRPRWAFVGGLLCAAYFVLMKFYVMPIHRTGATDKETFTWMFKGLIPVGEQGFGAVLRTIFSNPVFVLKSLLVEDKYVYLMQLLGPVLFLPFRSARAWILLLAPTLFTLLSTGYKPTVQTYFQYSSNWTSYMFLAAAVTLSAWRGLGNARVRIAAAVTALVATSTVFSFHRGAIFQHNTFRGGFRHVQFEISPRDRRRHDDLYALIAMIPPDASVAATETEAPHVSNREDCFTMRFGYDDADYLLVAIAEARGGRKRTKRHMQKALDSGRYGFVARRGDFVLWGRGKPKDRNAEGAKMLGLRLPE